MSDYKFDPNKPGITPELYEQHQRNRARMKAGFGPAQYSEAEAGPKGQLGRDALTAWYEHAIFLAADNIAEYFTRPGIIASPAPSYKSYPVRLKRRLHENVASGVVAMLKTGPRAPSTTPNDGETPEQERHRARERVRKLLYRFRPLLDAAILERIDIRTRGAAKDDTPDDQTVTDAAAEILTRLNQPFRSPFEQS